MATVASGCVPVDHARFNMDVTNESGEDVVVRWPDEDGVTHELAVPAGQGYGLDVECAGTWFSITTADGEELAMFDEPACPRTRLLVAVDGSVTYTEND